MRLRRFLILNSLFFLSNLCFAQSKLGNSLDSLFTSYLDSGFSGSVLVAEKNKVVLKKGYGYANNETKKLNTSKTLFNVASIGKLFTVYSVLLLEKKGLLSTNDYLAKYIGEFSDVRDSVTIHHLLIHSSGIFKEGAALDYTTRTKFIQSVRDSAIESNPGEKYRYSNAGYSMLAAVVEIVSGKSFENFLWENIFEPCKMNNTGFPWELRVNKSLFATGYNSEHQSLASQEDIWAARGPGNLVMSVEDLYKWMKCFQNEKFVSTDIKNKILYDYLPNRDTYSWNKTTTTRKTRFYHKGGGREDFESRLMWYPDDEVIIMFFINNDYNLARNLFNIIRARMN